MGMPPLLPDVPGPAHKSSYKPILLTLLFSFLLGAGSCFGFLTTLNFNRTTTAPQVFAVAFMICVVTFVSTIIWLAVKAIRDAINRQRGQQ